VFAALDAQSRVFKEKIGPVIDESWTFTTAVRAQFSVKRESQKAALSALELPKTAQNDARQSREC
jgi:hypothetical protein